jgi:hypothetical protein
MTGSENSDGRKAQMSGDAFKYLLRFTIQPGYFEEERLNNLITFCKQAKIDNVAFFVDCEELNGGHIDPEGLKPWLDMIARAKEKLLPTGIMISINPWTTILHGDRGRKLKPGQDFTLMTDSNGRQATAQACPLCPEWRKYIAGIYAMYATLKPEFIWVEDDFRFHNHPPLAWGGCFCDKHMAEYSRRAGKILTRQDFVEGILKPGEPHHFRKIWLDCCRETMVENAKLIGDAVQAVSADTKVGLMSSVPEAHCAEGRDWGGILRGLSSGTEPVSRPALMSYSEALPQKYLWDFAAVAKLTRAFVPPDTEIYPELDNGPFSKFSKSHASTRLQLETSLFLCPNGMTISLFDMIGSGVNLAEDFQRLLAGSKPFLNKVAELGLDFENQEGVIIPVCPESSYTLHTAQGAGMTGLYPQETFWASLLASYGLAWRYSLKKKHFKETIAVSGQYFRNLEPAEITTLFRDNSVMMDGEAAATLYELGLGRLAAIGAAVWHETGSAYQTYEEVCDRINLSGVSGARMSAQARVGDYLEVAYTNDAEIKTMVKDYRGKLSGPGVTVIEGRHLIYPYGRFNGQTQGHLNSYRRELLLNIIKETKNGTKLVWVEESPYIAVAAFNREGSQALLITNFSNDPMPELHVQIPAGPVKTMTVIRRNGERKNAVKYSEKNQKIAVPGGIDRMETIAVLLNY